LGVNGTQWQGLFQLLLVPTPNKFFLAPPVDRVSLPGPVFHVGPDPGIWQPPFFAQVAFEQILLPNLLQGMAHLTSKSA